jgi:hypothetical protein
MKQRPQPPDRSILVTRPTNEFYGIYAALKQRQPYLFVVALMTILAEFLPILLTNVPYSLTQVQISSIICARISIVILALQLLTIAYSFFVRWPHLPVDPRTIAGAMYYVTDSFMLPAFGGLALLDRPDKDARIRQMGRRYHYGVITGRSGKRRMGVDSDVSLTNEVDTAYRGYQDRVDRMDIHQAPAPTAPAEAPTLVDGAFGAYPAYQEVSPGGVRTGYDGYDLGQQRLPNPDVGPSLSSYLGLGGGRGYQPLGPPGPPPSGPVPMTPDDVGGGNSRRYEEMRSGPPPVAGPSRRYDDMGPQGAML